MRWTISLPSKVPALVPRGEALEQFSHLSPVRHETIHMENNAQLERNRKIVLGIVFITLILVGSITLVLKVLIHFEEVNIKQSLFVGKSNPSRPTTVYLEYWSIAFSPDGKTLVSGSDDTHVRLWDVPSRNLKSTLVGHSSRVFCVAFASDGKTLASGSEDQAVMIWDVGKTYPRFTLNGHTSAVRCVAFSPDGKILASGSYDRTIILWNVRAGRQQGILKGHEGRLYSLAFTADGKTLVSGGGDNSVKIWDVEEQKERFTLVRNNETVHSLAIISNDKVLASGSSDGTVRFWDLSSGKILNTIQTRNDILSLAISIDGKMMAIGSDGDTLKLWDVESGKEIVKFENNHGFVKGVAFSANGKTLAACDSGSYEGSPTFPGQILLWDLPLTADTEPIKLTP